MESSTDNRLNRLAVLIPLAAAAIIYLSSTAGRAVIDYDEGYYSQVAKQMAISGDWVIPYADGVRFLEKPPFMYWLTAGSFQIFGINEFALRLPTALGVIALVWLVALMARRAFGPRAAIAAGLSMACSVGTYLFTREALHDIWLVLFLSLAIYAFFEWRLASGTSSRYALLFYGALAGAVLCKSLVGVAFPVGIVVVYFIFSRERPDWRSLRLLPGSLLFLVLAVPWHVLAAVRAPGFLWSFFVNEQFLRFLGRHDPPVLWSLSLPAFWALILVWLFPWTAFLPAAFAACRKPAPGGERMLVVLALAWAAVVLGFFSVTGRLEHYVFPALPALALLIGFALGKTEEGRLMRWGFRGLAALGILVLLAGILGGVWFLRGKHDFTNTAAPREDIITQNDYSILADMPPSIARNLMKPAATTAAVIVIGTLAALAFEQRRKRLHAVVSLSVAMAVVFAMTHWSLVICEDMISSKKFALAVSEEARPGDHVVVHGDYESANSLNFYEPLRVEVVEGVAYALIPGMKFPDAPKVVLTHEEFEALWKGAGRVFVLVPKDQLARLKLGGVRIMEVLDRALIRNR